ncbi:MULTISPECIES: phosphatase PAP2 family protein [Natronorubrum]|uniref:phosphatase PAP2 family protein n=1 Tax=Natronorubrum TaxID=134813 RepID=UPI003084565B
MWTMVGLEFDGSLASRREPETSRQWRLAGAAILITLVSVSRVGVGVHYPIDVIAGVIVGVCYLAVLLPIRTVAESHRDHAGASVTFAAGSGLALLAIRASGQPDTAALFGGCVGAFSSGSTHGRLESRGR